MQGTAAEKIPGGKLVRVKVDYGNSINDVKITGDFFLHPEESITKIESCLRGIDRNLEQNVIVEKIKNVVDSNGIILVGITEDAIAKTLKEAMK